MISVKGLHKFFNKGRQNEIHVINDVSLELPERGMIAVFGKSGCGKTTLLNVLGGLDGFAEGSVLIDGHNIRENTDELRNKYVGYVFQNYNLNKGESCYQNVADALRLCGITDGEEIDRRVTLALKGVGMEKYVKRLPDTLSGGQQQRVAIARAIVKNPRIILADEPTGNLDESNTVMVMDLLKAISRDHLVILVTHEAKLVDHYCDRVIELADGKISNVYTNEFAEGYAARNKNHVYLGELERSDVVSDFADVEYYGDKPELPIKLKIVNNAGKMYIQVCTDGVKVLDETGEIKLVEGVYETKDAPREENNAVNLSDLPTADGGVFGKLFSFAYSVKSSFKANFKSTKRNKLLRRCLLLLSIIVVFMTATFGTSFANLNDAHSSYNNNVFYVYTADAKTSDKINAAIGKEDSAIDYVRIWSNYGEPSDTQITFRVGSFETFNEKYSAGSYTTNAAFLGASLAEGKKVLAGKGSEPAQTEIILTSRVADALLEKSVYSYINSYDDLIGMISWSYNYRGKSLYVVGIVESDETAIYMNDLALANHAFRYGGYSQTEPASRLGFDVSRGEVTVITPSTLSSSVAVGDTIKLHGLSFTVSGLISNYGSYDLWLAPSGYAKVDIDKYFADLLSEQSPELQSSSDEYVIALSRLKNERYFEYFDYYYAELDEYIRILRIFGDEDAWMYLDKGITEARYVHVDDDYYKAICYKNVKGEYPAKDEYDLIKSMLPEKLAIYEKYSIYYDEYYSDSSLQAISEVTYVVNDSDYIALSKRIGETHGGATDGIARDCFTLIHSTNPKVTEEWIYTEFGDLISYEFPAIYTPDIMFQNKIKDVRSQIVGKIIATVLILAVMCACMYLIVRSSLLNRVKEIGIYRAIGVSKKNMLFRFFVESATLTALTVIVGYLISSVFIFVVIGLSPLVSDVLYYPVWYATAVFAFLLFAGILSGTIPVLSLLRKTPSEILAKYDI